MLFSKADRDSTRKYFRTDSVFLLNNVVGRIQQVLTELAPIFCRSFGAVFSRPITLVKFSVNKLRPSDYNLPTCYSIYLAFVDDYLRELGQDSALVFRAAGVDHLETLLSNPRISLEVLAKVYGRVYQYQRLPGFFIELGKRIPVTAHGSLGVTFMVCTDLRAVMHTLQRFTEIALPMVKIELFEDGDFAEVSVSVSVACPHFRAALIESIASHIITCIQTLTSSDLRPTKLTFQQSAPPYAELFKPLAHERVAFDAVRNSLFFHSSVLEQPIKTANKLNETLLVKQCIEELLSLQTQVGLVSRVRELIALTLTEQPSAQLIAGKMSMSERSLRRHLNAESVSFRDLLKQVRHQMACHYLTHTQMSIKDISKHLGYSEAASFSQSFSQLTGQSPRQWRNRSN